MMKYLPTNQTFWSSLLLVAALCLSTWFMLSVSEEFNHFTKPSTTQADAYMKNVAYKDFTETGMLHSQMTTPFMQHYPLNNAAYFVTPHFLFFSKTEQPWDVSAAKGYATGGIQTVQLFHNVVLFQPANKAGAWTRIHTEHLVVYPQKNQGYTKEAVNILRNNTEITGRGMTADLKTGNFKILSQAKGRYVTQHTQG